MFVASAPATPSPRPGLFLIRAQRQSFAGPAEFLRDPAQRAEVGAYLADMVRPYAREVPPGLFGEPLSPDLGQSYGEMGQALLGSLVAPDEPVDLLVLAFSVHDLWPGRATAAYLSRLCPGTPMSFAICDQGTAAAFSGLRIAGEYAASAGCRRVLLIVVEQAALPYPCAAAVPARHRGVAMLYGDGDGDGDGDAGGAAPPARVTGIRQYRSQADGEIAGLAAAAVAELSAGHRDVRLVLSEALAAVWSPGRQPGSAGQAVPGVSGLRRIRIAPPGQPGTGVWWELAGELTSRADGTGLLVAADYEAGLGYLSLAAIEPG